MLSCKYLLILPMSSICVGFLAWLKHWTLDRQKQSFKMQFWKEIKFLLGLSAVLARLKKQKAWGIEKFALGVS